VWWLLLYVFFYFSSTVVMMMHGVLKDESIINGLDKLEDDEYSPMDE